MKHIFYIFGIVLFLSMGLIAMNTTSNTNSYDQPMYYLKFSVAKSSIEVRLNDIPVLNETGQGRMSSEKPVPESIVNGENSLIVKLSTLDNEETLFTNDKSADVELVVREKNAPLNEYETLIHLNIEATEDKNAVLEKSNTEHGDNPPKLVKHDNQEIVANRSTHIDSPFPRWAWQDGVTIKDTEENFSELLDKYKEIHSALSDGDMSAIKDLYAPAAKEFAFAYHYDDIEQGHRIINTGEFVGDEDWELVNIEDLLGTGLGLRLDIFANGKIARIVDSDGDELLIVYKRSDGELYSFQKFGFYKNKDGEWIMIR